MSADRRQKRVKSAKNAPKVSPAPRESRENGSTHGDQEFHDLLRSFPSWELYGHPTRETVLSGGIFQDWFCQFDYAKHAVNALAETTGCLGEDDQRALLKLVARGIASMENDLHGMLDLKEAVERLPRLT